MGILNGLLSDPIGTIIFFLLAMPGRLMAISIHEWAHAYAAWRCGDPTARMRGRMKVNPLAHIDVIGFIMMLVAGFGWAKPVPVDPRNFRHYRRDDLKVSLAGITMNLIMFVAGLLVMYSVMALALHKAGGMEFGSEYYIYEYMGQLRFVANGGYLPVDELLVMAPYLGEYVIGPLFGDVAMYLYQMLMYFTITNLVLAIFNLIPVPPLDGSHVLDDLVLYRFRISIPYRVRQAMYVILIVLVINGAVGDVIGWVSDRVFMGAGAAAEALFGAMGLI